MDTQNEELNPQIPEPITKESGGFWHKNRILIKSLLIGTLTLLMLIPASFIRQLVYEREQRKEEVIEEVSAKWAQEQTLTGPIIKVPYWDYSTLADKSIIKVKKNAYFLPDQLSINGTIQPQIRHRSIYDVTLYNSDILMQGSFSPIDIAALSISPENIIWTEAEILVGINDLHGLEEDVQLHWNDTSYLLDAGLPENEILQNGLNKKIQINPETIANFKIHLKLKGSENLYFSPVGKSTKANIKSPWQHPSFEGKFIPSNAAAINNNGFDATWNILQVSSGIPKSWKDKKVDLFQSDFGIKLLQPNDGYGKTERSVKYAILFIGLTFTLFFFIEILQKKQIHPLQYLLVGFALSIFYTLLLSFTEYCGFNMAYAISASATILLIGIYVTGIFKKIKIALLFTGVLSALYAYIFVLIQLQDFALLFGSIGLFVILAIIMFYSRKIDWYGTLKQA
ncbi:MAG: cell envelope integrity protein CreD [Bacteroidota bacterium]